ncbi:MAG: hypothetical protein KIT84_30340 [Labilithrix sp.]|nr:hypothetical protein [Labilithrix sp.]MCW5815365.1 hypothetical protein [Labilithrix sp.]
MRKTAFIVWLFAAWMAIATLGGCKSKASLDADVDHLLTAIDTSDYEHFKADAHPGLIQEVSQAEFDEGHTAIKKLGPLKSKSMKGMQTSTNNGVTTTSGNYDLVFANGKCQLEIKSIGGKLLAFHFRNITMTS